MSGRALIVVAACSMLAACGDDAAAPTRAQPAPPAGRILFSQTDGEHSDIYAIRPDGHGLRRLTDSTGDALAADPSRDGTKIVYEEDEATRAVIAVMARDGSQRRVLTPDGYQGQPAWSPDERRIVFERDLKPGDNGVWVMDADGGRLRRLTLNPYAGEECGCDTDPAFSPDGGRISFVRVRAESRGRGALFVMDSDGGNLKRLTSWRLDPGTKHAWKPDGSQILISDNGHPARGESSNVIVLNADGSGLRALTRFKGGTPNALAGSWSPDGRDLVIKTDESGDFQLYVVSADGGRRRRITDSLSEPSGIVWTR